MEYLGIIGSIGSILGAIFALGAWCSNSKLKKELKGEKDRMDKKITVVLKHSNSKIELPIKIRRGDLTRAELLGRLGMIPLKDVIPLKDKKERFKLKDINSVEFFRQLDEINNGIGESVLTISCSQEEMDQFDTTIITN